MNLSPEQMLYERYDKGYRMASKEALQVATEFDDGLFLGGIKSAFNEEFLKAKGIQNIVSITEEPKLSHLGIVTDSLVLTNLSDDQNQDILSKIEQVISFIQDKKQKREKVLIHCQYGSSRSPTFAAAWLMHSDRMSLIDALDYLQSIRPSVIPNIGFLRQLLKYESSIFGSSDPK